MINIHIPSTLLILSAILFNVPRHRLLAVNFNPANAFFSSATRVIRAVEALVIAAVVDAGQAAMFSSAIDDTLELASERIARRRETGTSINDRQGPRRRRVRAVPMPIPTRALCTQYSPATSRGTTPS
jgi:hypothetical protein